MGARSRRSSSRSSKSNSRDRDDRGAKSSRGSSSRSSKSSSRSRSGGRNKGSGKKSDAVWRGLGTIYQSEKYDGMYIGLYDENVEIIVVDKKTGKAYIPKFLSLFEPQPFGNAKVPKNAEWNISVNLNSDNIEEVNLDELSYDGEDDDDDGDYED